ncbi:MAG: FAD-dependent oxidoreductase [Clostridia bacterium]|nr:FAD-dependent oxidoreductase [Clostridia bacterium]
MIYDVIIIGGGPAGLTAALYAARAGKKTLLVENYAIGGQASLTHNIENYPGITTSSGFDLTDSMRRQAESFGAEFMYDNIVELSLTGEEKSIRTEYSGTFICKKIILAMGAKAKMLGVDRERELSGRGVSYCATCDGGFYKGKEVAVVGGGDTALIDALYLKDVASKVYLIHRRGEYRGSVSLVAQIRSTQNIVEVLDSQVISLEGSPLEAVIIKSKTAAEPSKIDVKGLFVAVGLEPQTNLVEGEITLEDGYIVTDEEMRTNIPGVFAAGDIRKKTLRQVITACADGAIAASHI